MLNGLNQLWYDFLSDEFAKDYFIKLQAAVNLEYELTTCFPPKNQIFNAFNSCTLDNLKVVIIGQDPYHGDGEADGLCFSVNDSVKIPPSLRNVFREISSDLDLIFTPENGNLERWAKQGVLLLNSTLTVQKDAAASHQKLGWETFTDAVISKINSEKQHIVFLLWGNYAHKKGKHIDSENHLILKSGHPSPLSANQGKWFGNKHFSSANTYLKECGKIEIMW